MLLLAWRQLQLDRMRTLLTALAIGAAVAVILVLHAFEQGQYFQLARAVLDRGGDLIATQAGVANFIAVRSSIPQLSRGEVEAIDGVAAAHPMTAVPVIYEKQNRRTPIHLLVIDTKGGPATFVEGRPLQEDRDIVIDTSLAVKHDIHVGDTLVISDFEFKVCGITQGAAAFFTPLAFISYDSMIDLFLESELAPDISTFPLLSFLLVDVTSGADPKTVADAIESKVPSVDVFTPEQLAEKDVSLGRGLLGPIFGLLVGIGYVIGLLVVGLIMYSEVHTRLSDFGVLKALGFSNVRLGYAVLLQAILLLTVAIPIGVVLAVAISAVFHWVAPVYLFRVFEPVVFRQTILACLIFAVVGGWIPLRAIRRADPLLAFQGL